MFELTGKTALVTGASGGIGQAVARALHDGGAQVALSGTRQDALKQVAAALGGQAHVLPCDLGDPQAMSALVEQAVRTMGRLDILVNNAGITRDNLFVRMKDEDWDQVIAINLTAAMRLAKAALRGMMQARAGRIITITSVVGTTGNAGQANYAAAKAGLAGMTKSLASEVAPRGITVNAVAPGFIETPMTAALTDAQRSAIVSRIPMARMGQPKDVAAAVRYLASDEAAYITGATIHVNGGLAMV